MLCRMYAPHIGGVERHVEAISREADKEGHEVDIFTLTQEETKDRPPGKTVLPIRRTSIESGIRIHRKPKQLHSHLLKYILDAVPFIRESTAEKIVERDEIWGWMLWNLPTFLRADIIHIHDVFFWYWPIRLLLPWKKVFITFHGFEAGTLPTKSAKQARLRTAQWTRGNIAVGGWIEKWYGTRADAVTYGAGSCAFKNFKLETSKSKNTYFRAVFIGRISKDTGAQVYEDVIDSLPHVSLDLYGEGSKNGTIEDSCTVFPKYDIACVSSYLSIVEAMQSKVLVVAFATDELKLDYLKSHPRSDSMIILERKDQLESFLRNFSPKNYRKEVERAYEWAKEQTWRSVYKQYKVLWKITS